MVQIEWSAEAEEDLDNILAYYSKTSIQYSDSFFERIIDAIDNISNIL